MVRLLLLVAVCATSIVWPAASPPARAQQPDSLTPLQRQIELEKRRLASIDSEERRDALMRLGGMKRAEASRAAAQALRDLNPMVRVTAAHAIVSLPPAEVLALLAPLLSDKQEFVRREAAFVLGESGGINAIEPLRNLLMADKEIAVRAAAAIALGRIADPAAGPALIQALEAKPQKKKSEEYEFVRRSAAQSLGEVRAFSAVPALIATLQDESNSIDLRRAAATALGLIGSESAVPALRAAFNSEDPYLAEAARTALHRMRARSK